MTKTTRHDFSETLAFLFSSPKMPPLNRAAFLREVFFVLLVRGSILWGTGLLMLHLDASVEPFTFIFWLIVAVTVFMLCFYYIPYFCIMHRRLVFLGFPCPRLFGIGAASVMALFLPLSGSEYCWVDSIPLQFIEISIYISLMPWRDKIKVQKETAGSIQTIPTINEFSH